MRKLIPVLLCLAVLGAVPAAAADSAMCLRRVDVREWASPGPNTLIVQAETDRKVLLTLTQGCSGFGAYDGLSISGPTESRMSCISPGDTVHTTYAGERGRCRVVSVMPYSGKLPPRDSHM